MDNVDLNEDQRTIFIHVLESCSLMPETRIKEYKFQESNASSLVAITRFRDAEDIAVVFTLGSLSRHIYVAATYGDPDPVAAFVAEVEEYDSYASGVCFGYTYRSHSPYLATKSMAASIMLSPATLSDLSPLESGLGVGGRVLEFLLVVFLTDNEFQTKLDRGFDALMELFETRNKDAISS
jgi:hypothetical protein